MCDQNYLLFDPLVFLHLTVYYWWICCNVEIWLHKFEWCAFRCIYFQTFYYISTNIFAVLYVCTNVDSMMLDPLVIKHFITCLTDGFDILYRGMFAQLWNGF